MSQRQAAGSGANNYHTHSITPDRLLPRGPEGRRYWPTGDPSDQVGTATRKTRIGGKPSPWSSCSPFDEKNQWGLDMTGEPTAPESQSLPFLTCV